MQYLLFTSQQSELIFSEIPAQLWMIEAREREKGFSVIDWTRTVRWGGDGGWWWRRGQDGHDRFGLKHNSKNSQPLPRRHQSNPLYLPQAQISANEGPFPLKGGWWCKVAKPWWSSKSCGDRQYERCCTRTEGEWPSSDNIRGRGNSEIKEGDDDGDDDDYVDGYSAYSHQSKANRGGVLTVIMRW